MNFVCMPTAEKKYMWVINTPEKAEMLEDWRVASAIDKEEIMDSLPPKSWKGDAGHITRNASEVIRFGMYLRPISQVWHKGRIALLGDSAHPTMPFLGQGANMSCEDVYHLVRALVKNRPLTNESIDQAFTEYTAVRLPRVTRTINQSSKEMEFRLAKGEEALKLREAHQAKGLESDTWKTVFEMIQGPYTGESEI